MFEKVVVGLPQMDYSGLSENWLYKYCGDLHWRLLCQSFGVKSHELRDKDGRRILSVFLALSARFSEPLAAVRENDSLTVDAALARFGDRFHLSRIALRDDTRRLTVELLQTFAVREDEQRNVLTPAVVGQPRTGEVAVLSTPPELLRKFQTRRNRQVTSFDSFPSMGLAQPLAIAPSGRHVPSPFVDFNGAGVLYFASYPTIADTIERAIVTNAGWAPPDRDWAASSSTVGRDVFYLRNLELGAALVGRMNRVSRTDSLFLSEMAFFPEGEPSPLAEILTAKQIGPRASLARPAA